MAVIGPRSVVLFIGDSITDSRRSDDPSDELGIGYVRAAAGRFHVLHPRFDVTFVNRGVSADRVRDLRNRWSADVIAEQPDVVTILIGVNNTWRALDSNDPTSVEAFEDDYGAILERTKNETGASILLIEPFCLPVTEVTRRFRDDLDPKIQVVRRLASEYEADLLGADSLFAQYASQTEPKRWLWDGVHPTAAGHSLLADSWLDLVDVQ